jgi:hypothetical protein
VVIGGFHSRDTTRLAEDLTPDAVARHKPANGWMAHRWVTRAPPAAPPWSATRSSLWADAPATPSSWSPRPRSTTAPLARRRRHPDAGDHLAVTADSSYLYAVGGRKFTAGSNVDVVQRYDPKADRWTILTHTPQPVSGAGAAIVDGQLIVAGGEGVTTVSGTVQAST